MKIFCCPRCSADIFLDNLICTCGLSVGFSVARQSFVSDKNFCVNRDALGCNWTCDASGQLCLSCRTTRIHPDLSIDENYALWARAEAAKRHVLVGLMQWGWFTVDDASPRPEFHMLAEATAQGVADVTMGHASGVVTINLAEANPSERVRRREMLGEPYRTLIGHFRHEIAHYLFELLSSHDGFTEAFRAMFGDETHDYGAALARYYAHGAPLGWQNAHVTPYAAAHPHEDWAETAAHTMHLCDITDSFYAARLGQDGIPAGELNPFHPLDIAEMIETALSISVALNHVNRAVGQPDIYPFVNSVTTRQKLAFALTWLKKGPAAIENG
ncbi:MAG: hypothetical protein EA339_00435 [Rhodobacteraceae bacterium]|nr:MAG: hypothetical protein EA339_00435 [Paracoccaceae bacterium]